MKFLRTENLSPLFLFSHTNDIRTNRCQGIFPPSDGPMFGQPIRAHLKAVYKRCPILAPRFHGGLLEGSCRRNILLGAEEKSPSKHKFGTRVLMAILTMLEEVS